jgi:hypothetical protein
MKSSIQALAKPEQQSSKDSTSQEQQQQHLEKEMKL